MHDLIWAALAVAVLLAVWRAPRSWRAAVAGVGGAALAYLVGSRRRPPMPTPPPDRRHERELEELGSAEREHVSRVVEVEQRAELPREERAQAAADVVRGRR